MKPEPFSLAQVTQQPPPDWAQAIAEQQHRFLESLARYELPKPKWWWRLVPNWMTPLVFGWVYGPMPALSQDWDQISYSYGDDMTKLEISRINLQLKLQAVGSLTAEQAMEAVDAMEEMVRNIIATTQSDER